MIKRIVTALVLFAIVIPFLFFVPQFPYFQLFVALVVGIAAWEWSGFCFNLLGWRLAYAFLVVSFFFLLVGPLISTLFIILSLIVWGFAVFTVLSHGQKEQTILIKLFTGLVMICSFAIALIVLREESIAVLLVLLVTVWTADSLALLIGKKFGKNKLIPQVSPGKTWEGLYGGLFGAFIVSLCSAYYWQLPVFKLSGIILLTGLMSVIGDLFISCYKRQVGLDDTGSIFPGHGGMLDRIDGLLAATPFYWALLGLTGLSWH